MTTADSHAAPAAQERRYRSGFWTVAYAFLIVMAFATLPSPLYGLYRTRDHLSALMITVIYAIFAGGTIATLLFVRSIAARIGRRGVMISAVATMMVAAALLAAWKALPGLLIGRLIPGASVGLAAGTAITYLIELRLRADPNASIARARTIGTSVNVGALGVGPLIAGLLAQWGKLQLTLPYLVILGARSDRPGRLGGRARDGNAGSAGDTEEGAAGFTRRPDFPFRQLPERLQPSPRMGCSRGCLGSSWPPRFTALLTHCRAPHFPGVFLRSGVPACNGQAAERRVCSHSAPSPCS